MFPTSLVISLQFPLLIPPYLPELHIFEFPAVVLDLLSNLCIITPSVQSSCSVMSDSLQPHGLQHARLPCPSPIPGAYSSSCPLHWWCHPTVSSFVIPFSSHLQSLPRWFHSASGHTDTHICISSHPSFQLVQPKTLETSKYHVVAKIMGPVARLSAFDFWVQYLPMWSLCYRYYTEVPICTDNCFLTFSEKLMS